MKHNIGLSLLRCGLGLACFAVSSQSYAGSTSEVSIGQITVSMGSNFTRVQIIGNIIDIGCSNSGYVLLDQTATPQYESIFSMILSAYATGKKMAFNTSTQCVNYGSYNYAVVTAAYLQP